MKKKIIQLFIALSLFHNAANASENIKVYAAASMTNVVSELATQYSEQTGVKIITVFAGSSSLARQIQSGAPADIFISANKKWVDYLVEQQVVASEYVQDLAKNELVLITPTITSLDSFDLGNQNLWQETLAGERIALGEPNSVPAGIYAKEALTYLGVWQSVKDRVAPTQSVRVALAFVERGEACLGVVYKTDAILNDKVAIVDTLPSKSHSPIIYPIAKLTNNRKVNDFFAFLLSSESHETFKNYGFQ